MYGWLKTAPTEVLRRAEDLAVDQAQRHFEKGRPQDALEEYRIARVFGCELNRRGDR